MQNKPCIHVAYSKTGGTTMTRSIIAAHPDISVFNEKDYSPHVRQLLAKTFHLPPDESLPDKLCEVRMKEIEPSLDPNRVTFVPRSGWGFLSGEHDLWAARMLKELFGDAKPMFVIREQTDWLASHYLFMKMTKKIHIDTSMETFFRTLWEGVYHGLAPALNFDSKIRAYESVFGEENVGVFLFEELKKNPEQFVDTVYRFIGVEPDLAERKRQQKGRYTAEMTSEDRVPDFMSRVSRIGYLREKYNILPNVQIAKYLPEGLYKMLRNTVNPKFTPEVPQMWRDKIELYYADSNRQLDERRKLGLVRHGYPT